ncbi:uncharacterized protein N7459_000344 [Penicillium hispanicum]|uniref:uncharacterized protein n=1 Tax=Penicillium hispanicum TaxID=1080232 RepID=UPI0025416623|nr:uncharacterized protein N7459_000344 [Penicillium hispanicum]KAJ5594136.1 hypothetical protein N7459_000344 [Penicillium hispanicum]
MPSPSNNPVRRSRAVAEAATAVTRQTRCEGTASSPPPLLAWPSRERTLGAISISISIAYEAGPLHALQWNAVSCAQLGDCTSQSHAAREMDGAYALPSEWRLPRSPDSTGPRPDRSGQSALHCSTPSWVWFPGTGLALSASLESAQRAGCGESPQSILSAAVTLKSIAMAVLESMETPGRASINRWLATLSEETLSSPTARGMALHYPIMPSSLTSPGDSDPHGRLTVLEIPEIVPRILLPDSSMPDDHLPKQTRALTGDPAHGQNDQETFNHVYERRPRRKTREDRYEYKPAGSSRNRQSRSHKGKTKRLRRCRKQTMDDGFHASNVVRERLTLRANVNVGIFNKGRASSPIRFRGVPDLAFSETNFLSHKFRKSRERSKAIGDKSTRSVKREHARQQKLFDYAFHESPTPLERGSTSRGHQASSICHSGRDPTDMSISCHAPVLNNAASTGDHDAYHQSESPGPKRPRSKHQGSKAIQENGSATPYTWPDTVHTEDLSERAVEAQLLDILHSGLFSPRVVNENISNQMDGHCDLEQLRQMLESRKASWESKRGDPGQTTLASSLDYRQEPDPVIPQVVFGEAMSSDSTRSLSPHTILVNRAVSSPSKEPPYGRFSRSPCQYTNPDNGGSLNQAPRPIISRVNKDIHLPSTDDDEVFFRTLDMTYNEIMNSDGQSPEYAPAQSEEQHTSSRQLTFEKQGLASSSSANPSNYSLLLSPLPGQSKVDQLHSSSLAIPSCSSQRYISVDLSQVSVPSRSQNDPFPEDFFGQRLDSTYSNQPKQTLALSTASLDPSHTVPPGFWRQHRLY